MIPDPGYDLRTIVTAAVVIPIVALTATGLARLFSRLFRRWAGFTGRAIRSVVVESIEAALAPRFDGLEARLTALADENSEAHSEVTEHLDRHDRILDQHGDTLVSIDHRLSILESRRRDDRQPPQGK